MVIGPIPLLLAVVLALATAACGGGAVGARGESPAAGTVAPTPVEAGARFRLRTGEIASLVGGDLLVKLVAVRDDSRCPIDVTCVWAGDAEVVLATARRQGPWSQASLHTGIEPRELDAGGVTVSLLGVEPPPRSGVPIDPAAYVAVLLVRR